MQQSIYVSDIQVANRFGVSRASIWRWAKIGDFPKPVKLSPGCSRWKVEDVQKWAESRSSQSEVA